MAEIALEIAKKFIQRRDVKALQTPDGEYRPDRSPWKRSHVEAHLAGTATFGHYMLDTDSKCRLFAFDIDLEQTGFLPTPLPDPEQALLDTHAVLGTACNPRAIWQNRKHPARPWMKYQMRMIAEKLAGTASKDLDLPVAVAYSGSKGLHVYCFHPPMNAADSRAGARLVLETLDEFVPWHQDSGIKWKNKFIHRDTDPYTGYPNFTVEVYPKQDSIEPDRLGNLMRLPLGRNLKSPDPTFFVDLTAPINELRPTDALTALTSGNPWVKA